MTLGFLIATTLILVLLVGLAASKVIEEVEDAMTDKDAPPRPSFRKAEDPEKEAEGNEIYEII